MPPRTVDYSTAETWHPCGVIRGTDMHTSVVLEENVLRQKNNKPITKRRHEMNFAFVKSAGTPLREGDILSALGHHGAIDTGSFKRRPVSGFFFVWSDSCLRTDVGASRQR